MKFLADNVKLGQERADGTINVVLSVGEHQHNIIAELITSKYKDKNLEVEINIIDI